MSFWWGSVWQTMFKALNIFSATAWADLGLQKVLPILWDTTVKTYAVNKKTWKQTRNQKKSLISWGDKPIIHKFFKDFINHINKTPIQEPQMRPSNKLGSKTSSGTYWRVELGCKFRLIILQNYQLNVIRTRSLWCSYDLLINLGVDYYKYYEISY